MLILFFAVSDKINSINTTEIYTIENFVLTAQIDNYNMFKLIKFCKESRIAQKVRKYNRNDPIFKNIFIDTKFRY